MTFHTAYMQALQAKGWTPDRLYAEICVQFRGEPPCSHSVVESVKYKPKAWPNLKHALIISKILGFSLDSLSIHD